MTRTLSLADMLFRTDDKKYGLLIGKDIIRKGLRYCKQGLPNETGGIMIGHYSDDLKLAFVTDITGPPKDSILKPHDFYRGTKGLQKLLDTNWKKKKHYYIGEWHFHPFSVPLPSHCDDTQMISFANNRLLRCPEPLLVILGGNPIGDWKIKVFIYVKKVKKELGKCGQPK